MIASSPHKSEIELLERGLRLPLLGTIVRLAGALEAEPCELVAGMAWRSGGQAGQPAPGARRGRFAVDRPAEPT